MNGSSNEGLIKTAHGRSLSGATECPRDRLLERGAESLSNAELLAVLFRTGSRSASAVEVAHDVLREIGGLAGLKSVNGNLTRQPGIGKAKAATLHAAVELGCRLAKAEIKDREILNQPEVVARYLRLRYGSPDQEMLGALFLNVRYQVISEREIFRGTLCRAYVEPRAILKEALLVSAASLILFHCHPSGSASPSLEDLAFTRQMVKAAALLNIRVADHLILGGQGEWVSLSRRGVLTLPKSEDGE